MSNIPVYCFICIYRFQCRYCIHSNARALEISIIRNDTKISFSLKRETHTKSKQIYLVSKCCFKCQAFLLSDSFWLQNIHFTFTLTQFASSLNVCDGLDYYCSPDFIRVTKPLTRKILAPVSANHLLSSPAGLHNGCFIP